MANTNFKNIIIGFLAAFTIVGLLIFCIETNRSLLQVFSGFILFVLPVTFLSSFKSKVGAFILSFFVLILLYVTYKLGFTDIWIGAIIAAIIGGSAFYFRVNKTEVFDSEDYKQKSKQHHLNKKK